MIQLPQGLASLPQGLSNLPQGLSNLPQGLASLPNELIIIIFNFIKRITDKRQFLKTCKLYNNLTNELIKDSENKFIENYYKNRFAKIYCDFDGKVDYLKINSPAKFTIELCYDSYFDMIPTRYYNENNRQLMILLVCYGKLDLLKFAVNNGLLLNTYTCAIAAYYGHLDILKFAHNPADRWDKNNICGYAAENNQLEIIKWAIENGCAWDGSTCVTAAMFGHIDILKWLRANGCEWNKSTVLYAAKNGHLNILKWAVENGCEWDSDACYYAKRNGQLEVVKWALENGYTE